MRQSIIGPRGAVLARSDDWNWRGPGTFEMPAGSTAVAIRLGDFEVATDGEIITIPTVAPITGGPMIFAGPGGVLHVEISQVVT